MFYFKPQGGKGQALHQDNFYLKVLSQLFKRTIPTLVYLPLYGH
jgi:hypothetical protein